MKRATSHSAAGFTLLEMLLALSVFMLLCGAVLEVVMVTLRSSNLVHDDQARQEEIQALAAFLRKKLSSPLVQTQVISWTSPELAEGGGEGLLMGDPSHYAILAAVPQNGGGYQLRWAQSLAGGAGPDQLTALASVPRKVLGADAAALSWVTLLANVQDFSCQFRAPEDGAPWVDHWFDREHRPALVELKLSFVGQDRPVQLDFWIPSMTNPPKNRLEETVEP